MAQSVEHPTLGFGSGHGSCVRALRGTLHSQRGACFGFSVSVSLCPSPAHAVSFLSQIHKKKFKKTLQESNEDWIGSSDGTWKGEGREEIAGKVSGG